MGRPSLKTPEVVEEIINRLAEGEPLAKICKDDHLPAFRTVWQWEEDDAEFRQLSMRAREHGTHFIADECMEIADRTGLDPQDKRIRIDTRLRLIGKWNRKVYGEKALIGSDPDNPLPTHSLLDPAKLSSGALREVIEAYRDGTA